MLSTLEVPGVLEDLAFSLSKYCIYSRVNTVTKGALSPVTQEITRVLGALCQVVGPETKYVFLFLPHWHSYLWA
jgi:hypothetical protein